MAVFVVAQGRIDNREMLDKYVEMVIVTIHARGGRVLAFAEAPEVIEGSVGFPRTVILEFPSRESFQGWYDSPQYQAILSLRQNSTPGTLIVVEGVV